MKHPIQKYIPSIFGPVLIAKTSVLLTKELYEVQIGISLINMLSQAKTQTELRSAIENYDEIVYVSLFIFSLNLIATLIRLAYFIYKKTCTPETLKERKVAQLKAQMEIWNEIAPLHMERAQNQMELREIN